MSRRRTKNVLISLAVAIVGYVAALAAGVGTGVAFVVALTIGALGELSLWVQLLRWLRNSHTPSADRPR